MQSGFPFCFDHLIARHQSRRLSARALTLGNRVRAHRRSTIGCARINARQSGASARRLNKPRPLPGYTRMRSVNNKRYRQKCKQQWANGSFEKKKKKKQTKLLVVSSSLLVAMIRLHRRETNLWWAIRYLFRQLFPLDRSRSVCRWRNPTAENFCKYFVAALATEPPGEQCVPGSLFERLYTSYLTRRVRLVFLQVGRIGTTTGFGILRPWRTRAWKLELLTQPRSVENGGNCIVEVVQSAPIYRLIFD